MLPSSRGPLVARRAPLSRDLLIARTLRCGCRACLVDRDPHMRCGGPIARIAAVGGVRRRRAGCAATAQATAAAAAAVTAATHAPRLVVVRAAPLSFSATRHTTSLAPACINGIDASMSRSAHSGARTVDMPPACGGPQAPPSGRAASPARRRPQTRQCCRSEEARRADRNGLLQALRSRDVGSTVSCGDARGEHARPTGRGAP